MNHTKPIKRIIDTLADHVPPEMMEAPSPFAQLNTRASDERNLAFAVQNVSDPHEVARIIRKAMLANRGAGHWARFVNAVEAMR